MRKSLYIIGFVVLLCFCSCGRRARLISEKEMTKMYADMFLADQWLRDNPKMRSRIDTTLFFDPIFKKYGYSFKDYNYSLYYYCGRPDKLADITNKASELLKAEGERWQKIYDEDVHNRELNIENLVDYESVDFGKDSLRLSQLDSAWHKWLSDQLQPYEIVPGILAQMDSLRVIRDSLSRVDSLAHVDSIRNVMDSLARVDSLLLADSLARIDTLVMVKDSLSTADTMNIKKIPELR